MSHYATLEISCAVDEGKNDFLDIEQLPGDVNEIWVGISEGGVYSTIALDVAGAERLGRRIAEFLRANAELVTK